MANRYLAGIDIGTTGAKTMVFDLTGKAIASGYREYSCVYPKPNWVEQNAPLLVSSAMEASREAHLESRRGAAQTSPRLPFRPSAVARSFSIGPMSWSGP